MKLRRAATRQLALAAVAGLATLLVQQLPTAAVGLPTPSCIQVPTCAHAAGGGTIETEFTFNVPIPPLLVTNPIQAVGLGNQLVSTTWSMKDTNRLSEAAYVDDVGLFYAGPIAATGGGGSLDVGDGEQILGLNFGHFNATVSGTNTFGGTFTCANVAGPLPDSGGYTRVGVLVQFSGGAPGVCSVDGQPVPVVFNGVGVVQTDCSTSLGNPPSTLPSDSCPYGDGLTTAISKTIFDAAWAVEG